MTTPTPRTDAKSVDQTIDGLKVWAVEERGAGNDSTALSLEAAAYLLGSLKRNLAARDAELAAMKQRAEAAERKAEEAARDSARLDWMIEHGTDEGGGSGFEFRVYIPHDSECLRDAIDAAIAAKGEA